MLGYGIQFKFVFKLSRIIPLWGLFLFIFVGPQLSQGQVDPSTATLLNSTQSPEELDSDSLDSGRYQIRNLPPSPARHSSDVSSGSSTTLPPAKTSTSTLLPKSQEKISNQQSEVSEPSSSTSVTPPTMSPTSVPSTPSASNEINKWVLGGSEERIKDYMMLLHPADIRQNLVEITASTGVFYENSASNYWYRRYYSQGPLVSASASLWITPFLGVMGEFSSSLGSDMSGNPAGTRRIPADHQWWTTGLRFRQSFGLDRRSPHLLVGIDFSEQRINVPVDDPDRLRIKTTGVVLSLAVQIPSQPYHFWEMGTRLIPRENQQEGKTSSTARSGTSQQSYAVGFWIGSRFLFDRKNQIFWQLSHTLDKSLYDGQASQADPLSGQTPSGVQITQGLSLFRIGYTWAE